MMQEGTSTDPIRSPWQGAARLTQALTGAMLMRQAQAQDANSARQLAPGAPSSPYYPGATASPAASVSSSLPGSGGSAGASSLAQPGPQTPGGVVPNGGTMTITPPSGAGNVPLPPPRPPDAGMNLASSPSLGAPTGIAQAPPVQTASLDPSSGLGLRWGRTGQCRHQARRKAHSGECRRRPLGCRWVPALHRARSPAVREGRSRPSNVPPDLQVSRLLRKPRSRGLK